MDARAGLSFQESVVTLLVRQRSNKVHVKRMKRVLREMRIRGNQSVANVSSIPGFRRYSLLTGLNWRNRKALLEAQANAFNFAEIFKRISVKH